MYNKKCVYKNDAPGPMAATPAIPATMCDAEHKFNLLTETFNFICVCGQSKYYFDDPANGSLQGANAGYLVVGHEANTWSCANEVIKVDLTTNKCFKGQYTLTFDPDRYWCGSIPLAIHNFDIIKWDWTDNSGNNVPLVDLFNEICKEYNPSTGKVNRFTRLSTIPQLTNKTAAENKAGDFKCADPETGVESSTALTTSNAKIFGINIWGPNDKDGK